MSILHEPDIPGQDPSVEDGPNRIPPKPVAPVPMIAFLPDALLRLKQWVCWRYGFRDGKWTKVPYQPHRTERGAKADVPSTWGSYDEAWSAYRAPCGNDPAVIDGIGFEFAADDPYFGADVDNCLKDGEVMEWAVPIVEKLTTTYGEISPSGNGIKFIAKGKLPSDKGTRRAGMGPDGTGALEVYDHGRFFTITGNRWGDASEIADLQPVADELYALAKERPAKAATASKGKSRTAAQVPRDPWTNGMTVEGSGSNGVHDDAEIIRVASLSSKFAPLWQGGTNGFPSDSEADMSLANQLAFYCGSGHEDQVKRLFLQSGLGEREKVKDRTDYLDRTVAKAYEGRTDYFEWSPPRAVFPGKKAGSASPSSNGAPPSTNGTQAGPIKPASIPPEKFFRNWDWEEVEAPEGSESPVEGADAPKLRKAALRIETIAAELHMIKPHWPKRVIEQLFIQTPDYQPVYLNSAARLFAWIDRHASVDWTKGASFVTQERFYEHKRMTAPQYDAIETLPHWPPISGIYYMHPKVVAGDGSYLERLLNFFCPATPRDRQLIKALILTLFWGGSPGQRPGFLITGPDKDQEQGRGIGKSKLCDVISEELGGGYINVLPTDEMKAVVTRLLSTESGRKRIARLDNVKTHRFSWADLEGVITSSVISGHSMYHGEGRRPNTLVWLITLNGASLSKDMAQRVIVVKLGRPQFSSSWEDDVRGFCRTHRQELLGDIKAVLEQEPDVFMPALRWAAWERDILSKLDHYLDLESEIKARQDSIDDDQDEKEIIIEFFRTKLEEFKHNPDGDAVLIPSATIAEWVSQATRKNYATNQASAFLNGLSISNLSKSDRNGQRCWMWTGNQAKSKTPVSFDEWIMSVPGSGGSGGGSGRSRLIAYGNSP